MALTYSTITTGLDEIRTRIVQHRAQLTNARAAVTQAESALAAMAAQYGALVTDLDAAATAYPNDAAIKAAKADKDQLVAEFLALQAVATNMRTALASFAL